MSSTARCLAKGFLTMVMLIEAAVRELRRVDRWSPSFNEFAKRLRAQLRAEEDVVFAALEAMGRADCSRLIASLRREHWALRSLLADVERELVQGNRRGAVGNLLELGAALRTHERRERQEFDPMTVQLPEILDSELSAVIEDRPSAEPVRRGTLSENGNNPCILVGEFIRKGVCP